MGKFLFYIFFAFSVSAYEPEINFYGLPRHQDTFDLQFVSTIENHKIVQNFKIQNLKLEPNKRWFLNIKYLYRSKNNEINYFPKNRRDIKDSVFIKIKGENNKEKNIILKPDKSSVIYIYDVFVPDKIKEISFSYPDYSVFRVELMNFEYFDFEKQKDTFYQDLKNKKTNPFSPLLMDLGSALKYPEEQWRFADFEYFNWLNCEDVLLFIFKDLDTQARFFKRLAFFVEKRGYKGKVYNDLQLEGKHGWSAHDYRSSSLAEFFNKAAKEKIVLKKEEQALKDILLANNVLTLDTDGSLLLVEGKSIISVANSLSFPEKKKLLAHEAFHGLYFSNSNFRSEVENYFSNSLSEEQKTYFRKVFDFLTYESKDEYLMMNEFQAYILQQPYSEVDFYFKESIALRMKNSINSLNNKKIINDNPNMFINASVFLNKYIYTNYRYYGGDVFVLEI